ncbi:MAG: family 20 glycosylhydrolase [Carboxylicivirga sp.]|jgi:hexosaminidase|nr:family 20 glycosylhydrolase [Carboxylicivirga sp.]
MLLLLSLSACQVKETKLQPVNIIPQPNELTQQAGEFIINAETVVCLLSETDAADVLLDNLRLASGYPLKVVNEEIAKNAIVFKIEAGGFNNDEAYSLSVTKEKVLVKAKSAKGIFIATQTLRQLLPVNLEEAKLSEVKWSVPCVEIKDAPRFAWRGMHMDVSRHFFSVDYIKRFLDYMALYKMNTFHWHLTDDQGWRIEIKKYPELTQNGAFRTFNNHDKVCIERSKDNPAMAIPEKYMSEKDGEKVYGGYYTQEEIKEVIAYAAKRNITIVPEIDMPGHFKAAIDNYPEVSCFGKAGWGQTFSAPLCAGNEATYQLVEDILTEVAELFPSEYIHIGADEVEKTNWKKCPKCQKRIKKEKLHDEHELQSYFVHRIEKFLNGKGKRMIGWDEILEGGMSPTATMMFWRGWVPDAPVKAAKQGNDVIMSPTSHCYFDYGQNSGTLENVYGFEPVPEGLSAEEQKRIIGGQGNIWTEYIPSEAQVDFMSMPRMIALAEVLWTPADQKDWQDFFQRIGNHFNRLDVMKVNYRFPDIGGVYDQHVFVDKAKVEFTSQVKDAEIRYTTDGTRPTNESNLYSGPIEISENITLKARPFSKLGNGGDVIEATFTKTTYAKGIELPADAKPGLACDYYEGKRWKGVADIGVVDTKKKSVVTKAFELPEVAVKKGTSYALTYNGYFYADKDDVYTFSLLCDDAGVLKIADLIVVDNDGMHAPLKKIGQVALAKGWHPIELKYVEGGGGGTLKLTSADADGQFKPIVSELLKH